MGTGDAVQIMLFACTKERDPELLLPSLASTLASKGVNLNYVFFVPLPNAALSKPIQFGDVDMDKTLAWQYKQQQVWESHAHKLGASSVVHSLPPLPSINASRNVPDLKSIVLPSVTYAINWIRLFSRINKESTVKVLVTGSLFLVGEILQILQEESMQ